MTTYRTIVIDPPWPERGGGGRGAQEHYDLLDTSEIADVILAADPWRPDPDCHLYLWATNTHLPAGLELLARLGFRYITTLTWAKQSIGLGQYFRGQTEHVLFGVRGSAPIAPARRLSTLIAAHRGRHSEKPPRFYEIVEQVSPEPRLEMFARRRRVGWDVWGYEAPPESEARTQVPMFAEVAS
jgi:N6-adenosine-specific RNA methylase IME4